MSNKILEVTNKEISVEVLKGHDPKSFFVNRNGMYVWSNFKDRILDKLDSIVAGTNMSIVSFNLEIKSSDKQIESSLPEKHTFSEAEVCAVIAGLISEQAKGEKGELLNNGYANLFYTKDFVVSVRWSADDGEWHVGAWDRYDDDWYLGFRVFSPATES